MNREIIIYGNHFSDFYNQQEDKVKRKIDFVLDLIRNVERVPIKFLKNLEGSDALYEVRVSTFIKEIRILCFFDDDKIIVLLNCFTKKSQKTPRKEIEIGEKLKFEYFNNKDKENIK
ncbi:MAG: type II toxin-antitoxin system RelE/ParE family toxin [Ignavibacteriae bacterium]|nr:type II toxin-antitoxin system RelE/ParE family toxin [Ignavibacteriota bacterium]